MAQLPTPEENGKKLLAIFSRNGMRSGDALVMHFL
jgi:hypothetical protein